MDLSCVYEGVPDCGLRNGNRRLTDEEWDKYQKVTEDSEGFDTVRFPKEVVEFGIIMPILVCEKDFAREYEMYKKCSQAALDVYNRREDTQFQFGKVLKTNALFCRSCTFYLTFQARDTITHVCENFQAKVRIFMQDTPDVELVRLEARSSVNLVPDPVFAQWKPSERVLALTPEQTQEVRLRLNVEVAVPSESTPVPPPIESFTDMCLHSSIMKDMAFHKYSRPTSIQAQAMPVALSGRDLLGFAETDSGKIAAFTIPMIQHCLAQPLVRRGDGPLALVLAPTRTLAQQIEKEVKAFSRSLESFKTAIVVRGTNNAEQWSELRAGVNIVVATPRRFIEHLLQGNTSLSRISYVVLDEADRMLDLGFQPLIEEVMRDLPVKHQTLLFGKTMRWDIESLAQEYLTDPVRVQVRKASSSTTKEAQFFRVALEDEKIDQLLSFLFEEAARAERFRRPFRLTIVFVVKKMRCDEVVDTLVAQGFHAVALHGGRSQSEREAALREIRNGSAKILVATDVSLGFDVTGVDLVVNLDLPKAMEDYVHRIGRTGSSGQAISFYTSRDMFLVAQIRRVFHSGWLKDMTAAYGEAKKAEDRMTPSLFKTEGLAAGTWVLG
ncbi:ATP-dependent RNA helicase DBP2-like [Rhododendron vialii]|uniref:ATP-dependent RNA helicase DBP2-like n=1 Tax=Rhododendron vialii TaxID=182163 RepID=UPI00265FCF29|nr:ATP-dependent RNA helicase DBP2-like [Rhododendron vialii]